MNRKGMLLSPAIAICLFAVSSAYADDAAPSGYWYSTSEPGFENAAWILHFMPDGTFTLNGRACEKGQVVHEHTQSGVWSYESQVLKFETMMADGMRNYDVEQHITVLLDESRYEYRNAKTGHVVSVVKVDSTFVLPDCGPPIS